MTENHNGIFHVHSSRGVEKVTRRSCTCLFFSSMRLPCRHIFAVRQAAGENMYDKSLCDIRWTNDFFKNNQCIFSISFRIFILHFECHIKCHKRSPFNRKNTRYPEAFPQWCSPKEVLYKFEANLQENTHNEK